MYQSLNNIQDSLKVFFRYTLKLGFQVIPPRVLLRNPSAPVKHYAPPIILRIEDCKFACFFLFFLLPPKSKALKIDRLHGT